MRAESRQVSNFNKTYAAFTTFWERMQRVHTYALFAPPGVAILILWILGIMTRFVLLFAWLTLLPTIFFFPHTEQLAIRRPPLFHCIKKVFYDNILGIMLQARMKVIEKNGG